MASFLSNLFGGQPQQYKTADIYDSLRQQIFELPTKILNLGQDDRFAIIMETGLEDACYTLVAVADGSASLYFSNGGGIIGAGEHPQGSEAAKAFLDWVFPRLDGLELCNLLGDSEKQIFGACEDFGGSISRDFEALVRGCWSADGQQAWRGE